MQDDRLFDTILNRIRAIEANGRSEVTGSIEAIAFADLPAAGQAGRLRFVTDGRKIGEGGGAGTGVPAYDDGVDFRRTSDDSVVAA